jgi:hypothetical protein
MAGTIGADTVDAHTVIPLAARGSGHYVDIVRWSSATNDGRLRISRSAPNPWWRVLSTGQTRFHLWRGDGVTSCPAETD